MNKTNVTVPSTKGMSTLVRAKFGPGMLLQHEDLEQLNVYTRELSRLMFRSFFGCGVVRGLVVTPPVEECGKVKVTVGAGLALNCLGDPVYVPEPKDLTFSIDEHCDSTIKMSLWVVLCGATKNCAPRSSMCIDDDDTATSVCTRELDIFEIRVVSVRPTCVCGCAEPKEQPKAEKGKDPCLCADPTLDCHADHYAGRCGCSCGDGSNCDCQCILLAQLIKNEDDKEHPWHVDHRVRRFIRPVLMRDPQVEIEELARKKTQSQSHSYKQSLEVEQAETALEEAPPAPAADPAPRAVEQIETTTRRQRKTTPPQPESGGS